jgi:hypothetical protein
MKYHKISHLLIIFMLIGNLLFILPVIHDNTVKASSIFYVSATTGNNANPGTQSLPWLTISYAASNVNVVAGSTVFVMAGTYSESPTISKTGLSSAWITFKSYTTQTAIISGNLIITGHYIVFDSFKIQTSSGGAVHIQGGASYIKFQNNYITQTSTNDAMVLQCEGDSGALSYIEILNNQVMAGQKGIDCTNAFSNSIIAGNEVTTTDIGMAFDPYTTGGMNNNQIYNNYIHGSFATAALWIGNPSSPGGLDGFDIYNNIFVNSGGYCVTAGTCISCTFSNVRMINNVFVASSTVMHLVGETQTSWTFRNNIMQGNTMFNLKVGTTITADHNCYSTSTGQQGSSNVIGDPGMDATYHLTAGSICINAGSSTLAPTLDKDGNSRVGAVDIGAYEYGGGETTGTYYVSTAGNDANDGLTIGTAWRTIQKAMNTCNAGETALVVSGNYGETLTWTKSGTAGAYITIKALTYVIPGPSTASSMPQTMKVTINGNYLIYDGFACMGSSSGAGININGDFVTVENCYTKNTYWSGIEGFGPTHDIIITHNYVDSPVNNGNSQEALSLEGAGGGIYNFEISYNTVYSTKKEGIDVKVGCHDGIICYNTVYSQGPDIYIDNYGQSSYNIDVYGNYCYGQQDSVRLGFEENPSVMSYISIYNNIFKSSAQGVSENGDNYASHGEHIYIYNNVFDGGSGFRIHMNTGYVDVVVRNNIFSCSTPRQTLSGNDITWDHNFESGLPLWIDPSDVPDGYMLQAGSPCINAGISDTHSPLTDYWGTSRAGEPDQGIYEYQYGLNPPSSFVSTPSTTSIALSWTKGSGAETTIIRRRDDTYPTDYNNGTSIYNSTGSSCSDSGLLQGNKYYYRAWSFTSSGGNQWSTTNVSDAELTLPDAPTSGDINLSTTPVFSANISWVKGTGANNTVVLMKEGSIPSSYSDGTVIYNGTGTYVVQNITEGISVYFKAWSYAGWDTLYQYSSSGLVFSVNGSNGMYINCYDEETGMNLTFDVFITNGIGSDIYLESGCTNTLVINTNLLPTGTNCQIIINSTGYKTRVFYLDIDANLISYLNVYLPSNSSNVALYYLKVVETIEREYGNVDIPVEDATVAIMKYEANESGFTNISVLKTDANGYVNLYLLYGGTISYKVIISKDGYDTKVSDYIPQPPNEWGQTTEKIFRLVLSGSSVVVPSVYNFWDVTIFTATMNSNSTIYIVFSDSLSLTINSQVYLYEFYDGVLALIDSASYGAVSSYSYYVSGINTSRLHYCNLFLNSSASFGDGFNVQPIKIVILPIFSDVTRVKFNLETRIESMFGPGPLGSGSWCPTIICLISLCILASFGPFHVGYAIIITGFSMGLLSIIFSLWLTDVFPVAGTGSIGFIVGIGVLYILAKQPGDVL